MPFLSSKNDYFQQCNSVLEINWKIVVKYLITQGYSVEGIEPYKKAYEYFMVNTLSFDGATMTEDLNDVFNLDLDAMLHDYHYIHYNVAGSYYFTRIADNLMYTEMLKKRKSSWNAGARRVLLRLKSYLGFSWYARTKMGRVMSISDKINFLKDVEILINEN